MQADPPPAPKGPWEALRRYATHTHTVPCAGRKRDPNVPGADPPTGAPGRLGQAVLLGLAIQVVLSGIAISVQPAGGDPVEPPSHLQVPPVRSGDLALYAVQGPGGGDPPAVAGQEVMAMAARWGERNHSLAADGTHRWTAPLTFFLDLGFGDWNNGPGGAGSLGSQRLSVDLSVTVDYEVGSWRATGTTMEVWSHHGAEVAGTFRLYEDDRLRWREDLADPTTPCGWHAPFHGRAANVTGPLAAVGDCPGPGGTLEAEAVDGLAGHETVRFASQGASPVEAWYSSSHPLPVMWSGPLSTLGFPVEKEATLVAAHLQPGDGPARAEAPNEAPPPWRVPTAPEAPWGPPEGDLPNVSFPLSEAYEVLVDRSPEVREFRQEHPDAYVARAWMYRDRDAAERPRTTWQVVLADGPDAVERFVGRSAPVDAPATDRQAQPPARVWTRDEAPVEAPPLPPRHPEPAQRPDALPVVAEVPIPRQGTGGYAPWEDPDPGYYSYRVGCAGEACRSVEAVVEVGAKPPASSTPAGERAWAANTSTIVAGLTPDGQISYLRGARDYGDASFERGTGAPNVQASPGSAVEPRNLALPDAGTAAGVSLVALLASALYYGWPKVKILAGGLYNRIGTDPDDVLENEQRQRILEIARDRPGVHFRELRRELDTGGGLLEHHLDKMLQANLLVEHDGDGYRCYFPAGAVDREVMEAAETLRSENAQAVLETLHEEPGASAKELAEELPLTPSGVSYHVDRLAEAGLVEKGRDGRSLALSLSDVGRRAIDELEIG